TSALPRDCLRCQGMRDLILQLSKSSIYSTKPCCGTGKVSVFVARAIRLLGIADILMFALCQMRTSRRMLF
ncbi:hypothetical protein KKZ51_23680, partial [Enterobacter roggenkampii]|nr:hypothetical protein [Enterobacter roggenkampii]MBT2034822.1 hypothetical protein [Enterobacter roggenkampii]